MKKPEVILVFGRICSGKSTFQSQSYRIIVSNIVRGLMQTNDRSVLQNSLDLDERIAVEIVSCIAALETAVMHELIADKPIIVDGIRQSSIVDYVLQWYPGCDMVWLDVPEKKRKERYESRKDSKDTEAFEIADNKPIELECQKIYNTFKDKLQIIHNH